MRRRLRALGGLRGLWTARTEAFDDVLPPSALPRLDAMFALLDLLISEPRRTPAIDSADAVAEYLRPRLALRTTESFWVLSLDARGRVIGEECVAIGTLTACLVHPREIFAPALRVRAAQVVVAHNHPSGDPTPSEEDLELTERLAEAGALLGIPLVDHVVIGTRGHRSLGTPSVKRTARSGL